MGYTGVMPALDTRQGACRDQAARYVWEEEMLQAIRDGRAAAQQFHKGTVQPEAVDELRHAVRRGEQCREQLTLSLFPRMTAIARRYKGISPEELVQEGALKLLQTIDSCSGSEAHLPPMKTIVNRALSQVLQQKHIISVPRGITMAARKIYKVAKCLERDTGREPGYERIANEMRIPFGIARKLFRYIQTSDVRYLDTLIADTDGITFGESLPSEDPTPDEVAEREDLRTRILDMLRTLEPMEESVIKLRFGFIGGEVFDATETAQELHITLEEEQRLEFMAMRRLQHPSRSKLLRDYL